MRIERVTIGIDWKNTENYNSDRYSISFTAELESGDVLEQVEQKLYEQCRTYLEKVSANGRNNCVSGVLSVNTENEQKPQQSPAPQVRDEGEQKIEKNDKCYKLRDARNRTVKQLIDELKVCSANHAGYLRMQGTISYKEWRALHEYFNTKEIAEHA